MSGERGTCLKRYERESLAKSFILFFVLMALLYALFVAMNYRDRRRQLDESILSEMKIFSFKPLGDRFDVTFVPKSPDWRPWHLYRSEEGVYALFEIPGSRKHLMRVLLPKAEYDRRVRALLGDVLKGWPLFLILIALLALLFSLYALSPYRRALRLNEEFIRDVLHDINTPLGSLRIDLGILRKRLGEDRSVERMVTSLDRVRSLQENLRLFLSRSPTSKESFVLRKALEERIEVLRGLYPGIGFELHLSGDPKLECNREAFVRILENLLSNAAKYNREGGQVRIALEGNILRIQDNGIGIREPQRAFDRYYKEGERGLGLGLHIVKKLAEEMKIGIILESVEGEGTTVGLDLGEVMQG